MPTQIAGRTIRAEADARACFAAMEAEGLSAMGYARAHGVSTRSLTRWRKILNTAASAAPAGVATDSRPGSRLDVERIEAMLADWAEAGGDLATFCRARGLPLPATAAAQSGGGRGKRAAPAGVRLVEVVAAAPKPEQAAPPARYEVVLGGVSVVVGDDFREDTLRRLMAAVSPC